MVINNKILRYSLLYFALAFSMQVSGQTTDSDGDGVSDAKDLCPGTASGVTVNSSGCPTSIATCDYSTSSFTLNVVGTAPTETRYLLVNSATGLIEQVATTPSFTGLTGTKTYMALAYSYTGTATGLTVGSPLTGVSAACEEYSNALMLKVCVPAALPTLSISDATVNENAGTATVTITLSAAQSSSVTVNYATADNTALQVLDYTTTNGTLTFNAGEVSKTITVPIVDNTVNEPTENFYVNLSNPVGATIADAQGVITILDNDVAVNDSDGDGVTDDKDLCPNTPTGTTVNAYGCPTTLATCDFTTSSISVVSATAPAGKETRYVLADATTGTIVQVNTTPSFTGLVGTKTYMVLAISYENDGTLTNLLPNNTISQVSAACYDWSNALPIKVCVASNGNGTCDYSTSSVTLNTGTSPLGATTKYVLVNISGVIVQVTDTPTFTGLSGTNTYDAYALSYTGSITNLSVGSTISAVNGSCYDWSNPLNFKVCVCKPNLCLPVSIVKVK